MKRREFITLIGGAAAWPLMSRAQGRTARVGALMVIAETDSESERLADAFERGLGAAGWYKGRNLELTYRWGASNPDLLSRYAEELVRAAPNILLAFGTAALAPMHKATTTIPIVFTAVSDPVAQGFVASLAHPRRNMTGFSNYEPDIGRRWLQLLKEVAPSATQIAVLFNPRTSPYNTLWMQSIDAAAPGFSVSTSQVSVQSDEDIRRAFDTLRTKPGTGLIVPSDSFTFERAALIASLAMDGRIPAVYAFSRFAHEGGLISYRL
jgi:putative tryptophan/tyrosine transport system substrate-binding protein